MKPWQIEALALGIIVVAIFAVLCCVLAIAFPSDDEGPRGGGFVE